MPHSCGLSTAYPHAVMGVPMTTLFTLSRPHFKTIFENVFRFPFTNAGTLSAKSTFLLIFSSYFNFFDCYYGTWIYKFCQLVVCIKIEKKKRHRNDVLSVLNFSTNHFVARMFVRQPMNRNGLLRSCQQRLLG